MLRRLLRRLTKGAGLHPDMTVEPLAVDADLPVITEVSPVERSSSVDLHPDLDWDGEQLGSQGFSEPGFVDVRI